jgi:hypothetical protein
LKNSAKPSIPSDSASEVISSAGLHGLRRLVEEAGQRYVEEI